MTAARLLRVLPPRPDAIGPSARARALRSNEGELQVETSRMPFAIIELPSAGRLLPIATLRANRNVHGQSASVISSMS
jgi:hypothetical protein